MNIIKLLVSILVSTLIVLSSYGVVLAGGAEDIDPAGLYEKKCSMCHSIERSKSKKKSEKGWRKTVMKMKKNGATITDEEAEIIIKHLSDQYGK